MKICSKCKVEKPESEFSKDIQKKDGLKYSCKECSSKSNNPEFFKQNKQKKDLFSQGFKTCSKCNQTKALDLFYVNRSSVDGHTYLCIDCICPNSPEIENKRLFKEGNRKCSKCGKIKTLDEFHNRPKTNSGKRTVCKDCRSKKAARPSAVKERINKQLLFDQGLKKCTICKEIKSIKSFGVSNASPWGVLCMCKECISQGDKSARKEYYLKNKEKLSTKTNNKNKLPSKSNTFFKQLPIADMPKIDEDGFIVVDCYFCHKQFRPKASDIKNRIGAIKGLIKGERNFYCSESCKASCPTYHFNPRQIDPRSILYVPQTEAQQARAATKTATIKKALCDKHGALVCDRCGDIGDVELHHTLPVAQYGMQSVNPDSYLLLCPGCHMALHRECV